MYEYTTYGAGLMENIRKILLDYKKEHRLTNAELAQKCDMSISEYDKIVYSNSFGKYGCSIDTAYKIHINLNIAPDKILFIE